jgi:predicted ATP-grasp superfamily ATP-dependent carboligase
LEEANDAWRRLSISSESSMILQQLLSGPCFAVSAVFNEAHSCISAFTMRKAAICARGSTWSAECVSVAELERDFAAFMSELRWTGPCEGEFMFDAQTRRFHLFEVNPRFTGWISASAPLGVNQPEMVARMALGLPSAVRGSPRSQYFMRAVDELPVSPTRLSALMTKGVLRYAS